MKQLIAIVLGLTSLWLAAAEWKNVNPAESELKTSPDGFTVTATGQARWDGAVQQTWREAPLQAAQLEFSADIKASGSNFAYLQVKLFQNGKEVKRFDSRSNSARPGRLKVLFSPAGADRVELLCRTRLTEANRGRKAEFSDFYFGIPRPEKVQQLPRLEVVPGYTVCSLTLNNCKQPPQTELYLSANGGKETQQRFSLDPIPGEHCARGSLLNLKENTPYSLRLVVREGELREELTARFTTQATTVPVAKTIVLKSGDRLAVTESGTPQGYIRYIAAPGFVLDAGERHPEAVLLDDVEYILLDGLTIRGGKINAVNINGSSNIRILNCDIAGFGRIGKQHPDLDGKFFENGRPLNNDAGIRIHGSRNILIERNYIHDPRGSANSWFYSHPAGPNAIFVGETVGAAIRYNDFPGSDAKRWNDVIEGRGNGSPFGSIYRDAEVTGNYLAFANDDGMELDGGQQNCRFFGNKTEGALCGVSTAPCLGGPSYLWNNLFCDLGDELGLVGVGFKNNYGRLGLGKVYIFENTVAGNGSAVSNFGGKAEEYAAAGKPDKLFMRNNLFAVTGSLLSPGLLRPEIRCDLDCDWLWSENEAVQSLVDFQKAGQEKNGRNIRPEFADPAAGAYTVKESGFGAQGDVPSRPTPFRVSRSRIALSMTDAAQPESAQLTVTVTQPDFKGAYRIIRNEATRFFDVTPASGILEPGKPVTLTVRVVPGQITSGRINRGAFLIWLEDGLSRPVSVQVDSTCSLPLVRRDRKEVIFGKVSPKNEKNETELQFDLPKAGDYYLFVRMKGRNPGRIALSGPDGLSDERIMLSPKTLPQSWNCLASHVYRGQPNRPLKLKAGKVKLTARQISDFQFEIKDVALAPDPLMMLSPLPAPPENQRRILLAGDSTVTDYPVRQAPMNGWGQQLNAYLPAQYEVRNFAAGGRSTKSFRTEGRWDKLLAETRKGDLVLIQFGHNDQKKDRPAIHAPAETDYQTNLKRFIDEVRERGAEAIIVTPIQRRIFAKDGSFRPSLGGYPDAARAVASAKQCRLIDLNRFTETLLRTEGPENSKRLFTFAAPGEYPGYPEGSADNSHLNVTGAAIIAAEVARQLDLK